MSCSDSRAGRRNELRSQDFATRARGARPPREPAGGFRTSSNRHGRRQLARNKGQRVNSDAPRWVRHKGKTSATWHDARARGLPPGSWSERLSPLLLLRQDPERRHESTGRATIRFGGAAAVATVLVALVFAVTTSAAPGAWIAGFDEIVFVAVGIGALWHGPTNLHVGAALGLGLLGFAVGLSKLPVFLHPRRLVLRAQR